MITKSQLRGEIAAIRHSLDAHWVEETSTAIVKRLQTMDAFRTANSVALYMALDGEVLLTSLFPICWKQGKSTYIPVFNKKRKLYEMTEVHASTRYHIGNYGIQEPVSPSPVSMSGIDLVVVPGVAFDASGKRLGRGGGYYDRLLADYTGKVAAIAFDFQIFPYIPCDSHDIPVDFVVTETKLVEVCDEH